MNKKLLCLLIVCCLIQAPWAYGQKNLKTLFKSLTRRISPLPPAAASPAGKAALQTAAAFTHAASATSSLLPATQSLGRAETDRLYKRLNQTLTAFQEQKKKLIKQNMAAFDANFLQSVGELQSPFLKEILPMEGSAFFIEEEYQGKKYLWGVTAAHMVDYIGPDITLRITPEPDFALEVPITVVAVGNTGMADVALFKTKTDISDFVRPIALAKQPVQPDDMLRSYGFFEGAFRIVSNRMVLAATPGRIVTSFEFGNRERAGACGGPVLNENNELVGIHCGSSLSRQESYAVPVSFLKDLLYAAHNGGVKERDLILNGRKIGSINIDEYIYSIALKKRGRETLSFQPWHAEAKVDYAHLENLISLPSSGVLELMILKGGTVQTGTAPIVRQRLLEVNLKTGKITESEL